MSEAVFHLSPEQALYIGMGLGLLFGIIIWRSAKSREQEREAFADAFAEAGRNLYSLIERGKR